MALPFSCAAILAARLTACAGRRTALPHDRRRGLSHFDVLVASAVLLIAAALFLPKLAERHERTPGFQNTCRNNLSHLAKALFIYANRNGGQLPGYMNALRRIDGALYVNPRNGKQTPVSWVVEVLPDIDRQSTYEQYRSITPQADKDSAGRPRWLQDLYIDLLTCPGDPSASRPGTPISFVVNTGLPDAPLAALGIENPMPRDWPANGVFQDMYTSDPRVSGKSQHHPARQIVRMETLRRPKDTIIMLTENVDADSYVIDVDRDAADDWRRVEATLGMTWSADIVASDGALRRHPAPPALHMNEGYGRSPIGTMSQARPSSRHPGGFNVAFVGQNVMFLRDTIDYYVYAKLLTSNDADLMRPGTREPIAKLGDVWLTDEMINP
ncbi:MAG: DUF1559 domain-containing protein [Pirellulales bacterium]